MFLRDEPRASIRCRLCALNNARSYPENFGKPDLRIIANALTAKMRSERKTADHDRIL
jgi:hypothetical protein